MAFGFVIRRLRGQGFGDEDWGSALSPETPNPNSSTLNPFKGLK